MSQNPATSPSGLIAMSCVLPILSIAAISLRFWLRGGQTSQLRIDDWLMIPALVRNPSPVLHYQDQVVRTSRTLRTPLPAGSIHWHVHMRHPRYTWPIKSLHYMFTSTSVGVHKHAWGYPNLDPEDGIEAFNICQIYEGQVSVNNGFPFLVNLRLTRSHLAIRSVPIHSDTYPRMHQTRSTILLSPHLLHWGGGLCDIYQYTSPIYGGDSPMDDCDDCDECTSMRVPYKCTLDH